MQELEDRLFERWCRRGDTRALGELFDLASPRLLKLAIHLAGDPVEAEDLVQATFLAAIEQRASVDPTRPVMPWLSGVLAHKAQQHKRRTARPIDAERLAARAQADPLEPLLGRELDGELAKALDQLDEPYRRVLVLRLRHGLAIADIAHVLERDPGTVRVQLHRGLEKLRALLPAALATSLLVGFVTTRGLAAVKAEVLREAALVAVTSTSILGSLIVSKTLLASAAAAIAVVLIVWLRHGAEQAATPSESDDPRASVEPSAKTFAPTELVLPQPSAPVEVPERAAVEPARSAAAGLHGIVLDAETHAPIAGAHLRMFEPREAFALDLAREAPELYAIDVNGSVKSRARGDWPLIVAPRAGARAGRERLLAYDRPRAADAPLGEAISASDGSFSLPYGARGGVIECESAGYAKRWRPVCDASALANVALWRERAVHGIVVGPDGKPLQEPLDLVLSAAAPWSEERRRTWTPGSGDGATEAIGSWAVHSGDDGRFVAVLGAQEVSVAILSPGWTTSMPIIYPVDSELRIQVDRAPTFHVFDAASGAPIERVNLIGREMSDQYVRWSGQHRAPGGLLKLPGEITYQTSINASYTFVFWSDGYSASTRTIVNMDQGGTTEVPLERGASATLDGLVRRGNEAIANAEVALLGLSPLQWSIDDEWVIDAVSTARDGRFHLEAPAGSYVLRVRTDDAPFFEYRSFADHPNSWQLRPIAGREPFFQVVELPASKTLDVDLAHTSAIEVEIVDTLGVAQVEHVVALHAKDGRMAMGYTDERGLMRFANLPAGKFQLHTPRVSTHGSFANGETREVELVLGETQHVRIEIPANTGPRHARVVARDVSDYSGWRARYDGGDWQTLASDGTVPLDLTTDRFEIEIHSPRNQGWHFPIPKDAPDGYVIELEAGSASYRGELLHADGTPWPGVAVYASTWDTCPQHKDSRSSTITDEDGAFELTGLADCEHVLQFQTRLDRSAWDEWGNDLAGVSFRPVAPPADPPTWISVRAAPQGESVRVRGIVKRANGERFKNAQLVFDCRVPNATGTLQIARHSTFTHAGEEGEFDVELPRTPELAVRVYTSWSSEGLALTQAIDPSLAATQPIELIVP